MSSVSSRLDRVRSWLSAAARFLLVGSALAMTTVVVRREFRRPPSNAAAAAVAPVPNWMEYATGGHRLGPNNAAALIIAFMDFQCPACGIMHQRLADALLRYPADFAVVYRHYPLPRHPFAREAALASECAAAQGGFAKMAGVLFANAASLGRLGWVDLAREAGVADGQSFANCMTDSSVMQAVRHDLEMGSKLQIRGTPTLLAAGKRYSGSISPFVLDSLIQSAIRHDQRD